MPLSKEEKAAKAEEIKSTEKIFMIELIIEKISLDVIENSDFNFRNAETCLQYKFLNKGPFKICENDFRGNVESPGCVGCGSHKNGHSTMFPIFPEQIVTLKRDGFEIDIEIVKLFKPHPKTIAKAQVPMKFIFIAVLDTMMKKYVDTAQKSMKNRYNLSDAEGNPVGYVDLFVRISSMGKILITKFQMDTARTCIEFESNSGTPYKYSKKKAVDEFVCAPCGKPRQFVPPYEVTPTTSPQFPPFKVTEDMKKRLLERRYKEQGIEPPPEVKPTPPKGRTSVNKNKEKPKSEIKQAPQPAKQPEKVKETDEPEKEPEEAPEQQPEEQAEEQPQDEVAAEKPEE